MTLATHSDQKYVTGHRLRTTNGLGWGAVLAEQWAHRKGRPEDTTPQVSEVIILLNGAGVVRREGDGRRQECAASPGTIWLCPAGVGDRNIELTADLPNVLHLFLPNDFLANVALRDFDADPRSVSLPYRCGFKDEFIFQIAHAMVEEMQVVSGFSSFRFETLEQNLAVQLYLKHSNLVRKAHHGRLGQGTLDRNRLRRVTDFVEANLSRKIHLHEIANVACLSPYHFSRVFKYTTQKTPLQFITERRLKKSLRLLSNSSLPLLEVANLCGFSNYSHFGNAFKTRFGTTPKEYRKANTFGG